MSYILDGSNWDLSIPTSIPNLIIAHLYITAISVLIGLAIAVPLALLVVRVRRLYLPIITASGILYTIPSLAAVAVLVPITGLAVPTIVIPLVLYAQVVLIRNIVAAIRAVDPTLVEVGRAMGMTGRQVQARVVLPLALPIIMAGIRVVVVTTIGIATIAPLIGVEDLGYLILQGINLYHPSQLYAGVILVSALAIVADLSLLGLQSWLSRGSPGIRTLAARIHLALPRRGG
jgi:osmoprotectant transport system permease protein